MINPGPIFSVECFEKCSPSIDTTSRVADSPVQHIMYSKHQLLGLRCKYSISDSLFYLQKDLQILNTRGLRAGVKTRSKLHQIPIILNRRNMAATRANSTGANLHNLVKIFCKQKPTAWSLPSVLLCNARSVFPKIDELRASLLFRLVDFVAVTESWLHADLPDSAVGIGGYDVHRKGRSGRLSGGVAAFVSSSVPCKRLKNMEHPDFECLWLNLRPHRLPRSVTSIYFAVVYNPPNSPVQNDLVSYVDSICGQYPDCGIVVLGDFNNLDISYFCN